MDIEFMIQTELFVVSVQVWLCSSTMCDRFSGCFCEINILTESQDDMYYSTLSLPKIAKQ